MPQINYDVEFAPNPPQLEFQMSAAEDVVRLKLTKNRLHVLVVPDPNAVTGGALTPSVFSAFLTAGARFLNAVTGGKIVREIGKEIEKYINNYVGQALADQSVELPLGDILQHTFTLDGVPLTLAAKNFTLDSFDGCMMAFGEPELR